MPLDAVLEDETVATPPAGRITLAASTLQALPAEVVRLRLRPEEEAVLVCARAAQDSAAQRRLAELFGDPSLDWQLFWSNAGLQEIAPLAARAVLSHATTSRLPESALDEAQRVRLGTTLASMAVHGELLAVAEALRARDIPVVPLKGTHLAQRLYGGLDARRPGDIDVLVPESHLEAARAELRRLGYAPAADVSHGIESHAFHGVPFVRQGSAGTFVVELHWGLSDPRFVTVDYPYLWQRVLAAAHEESSLWPLPGEETLLFLALHHAKHDVGVLRLLADIDRLLRREGPSLDWNLVLTLAKSWRVTGLLSVALAHAQVLFDSPIPDEIRRRVRQPAWRRALVGALAGPQAILRPPAPDHVRSNQFRLAYCAMLDPFWRAAHAYFFYLFAPYTYRGRGFLWNAVASVEGALRGVGWTAVLLGRSMVSRMRRGRTLTHGVG